MPATASHLFDWAFTSLGEIITGRNYLDWRLSWCSSGTESDSPSQPSEPFGIASWNRGPILRCRTHITMGRLGHVCRIYAGQQKQRYSESPRPHILGTEFLRRRGVGPLEYSTNHTRRVVEGPTRRRDTRHVWRWRVTARWYDHSLREVKGTLQLKTSLFGNCLELTSCTQANHTKATTLNFPGEIHVQMVMNRFLRIHAPCDSEEAFVNWMNHHLRPWEEGYITLFCILAIYILDFVNWYCRILVNMGGWIVGIWRWIEERWDVGNSVFHQISVVYYVQYNYVSYK